MLVFARRAASSSSCLHRHLLGVALSAQNNFYSSASATSTLSEDGSISYLRNPKNGAQLYLVGTAHVSAKSADQVREVNRLLISNSVSFYSVKSITRKPACLALINDIKFLVKSFLLRIFHCICIIVLFRSWTLR